MPLLERSSVLQQLEGFVPQVANGRGQIVSLGGEAGVGKSTVAHALASSVRGRLRVLWGVCEDLTTPEPLGPLRDLARSGGWRLPAIEGGAAQLPLFDYVLGELTTKPSLVVLEDLHWADDSTLDFVRFIGRRVRDSPVLMLLTARNDAVEAQNRLRRALVDVPPDISARIELSPLSESAVSELARERHQDGRKVFALTGGNPFLVTEVLRSAKECPETVRDALLARADRLSPDARAALQVASIFPRRVEDWLLEQTCGTAVGGVAECVASGLLRADRGFYYFRHEIARRAIEAAVDAAKLRQLNKHALEALRARLPNASARLVHHAIAAHDVDSICAIAPRAGDEAARSGAHREAARHYETALAFVETAPPERRAQLLEKSAFELQLIGRVGDALEARKQALALRRECGDELAVGDGLRWLSRLYYNVGDRAAAESCAQASIAALAPLAPGPELARAYANIALIKSILDDRTAALTWSQKTIELGEALQLDEVVADAYASLGVARQWTDIAAARADFEYSLSLALKLNLEALVGRIYSNAACIELNTRHGDNARALLVEGISYCRQRDLDTWTDYMRGWLAELLVREGKWGEALATAQSIIETPHASRLLRFPAVAALVRLHVRTGDEDPGSLVGELLTLGSEPQRLLIYAPIMGERAWIGEVGEGDAQRLLEEAAPIAASVGNIWAAGEIAYWLRKLGSEVDLPEKMASPFQLQLAGDWSAAATSWAKLPAPYEQALALVEGDEPAQAQGLAILDTLGARATAERVRKELRRRGVRKITRGPRPSTRANAAGLTRRQMEVLTLIDSGLSNADIAHRLGVSVKTVDHHVSAILNKLNASSRGEAAARARRAGLMGIGQRG